MKIELTIDGPTPSHLAIRLERPPAPTVTDLALLYMHGFGSRQAGQKADFFRQRFLDRGVTFCSFDFQGHGESGGRLDDLTLSRNLEDIGRVHAYLRARGYRRVVLMGSSMGGGSALWYAARHPESIAAAVHIAPALEMADGLLRFAGPEGARRWQQEGTFRFASELVTTDLHWGLIEDLRRHELDALQRTYRTPTLLLQGKNDTSVAWQAVVGFAVDCAFQGIEVHLMADGDHRLVDRLDHLWHLAEGFLVARGVLPALPRRLALSASGAGA